jgi:glycosyltransferase involved in cell wall biosynthesis
MRVTIDSAGSDVSAWVAALRVAARSEQIEVLYPSLMARALGSAGLDFAIRGSDVFHASHATPSAPGKAKLTATVEDLSCWLMPDLHSSAQMKSAAMFAERILTRADALIAVSEAARKDAIRLLRIPSEKITTIYRGVDAAFFDARPAPRSRPYVLCSGDPSPRMNFATLQQAWQELQPELRGDYDLVTLDQTAPTDLPGLIAGATLLAYLPLYDSFPLPVAQAMAAGVAVVISETSGVPEIGRDAGLMVDPHSPSAIAAAITRLLESNSERAKLARYGRARAELYRWEKCATESLAFFHRVTGK